VNGASERFTWHRVNPASSSANRDDRAIFKHMTESNIFIGILKIVKDGLPKRHKYYVSEAVEIGRRADDDSARSHNLRRRSSAM